MGFEARCISKLPASSIITESLHCTRLIKNAEGSLRLLVRRLHLKCPVRLFIQISECLHDLLVIYTVSEEKKSQFCIRRFISGCSILYRFNVISVLKNETSKAPLHKMKLQRTRKALFTHRYLSFIVVLNENGICQSSVVHNLQILKLNQEIFK